MKSSDLSEVLRQHATIRIPLVQHIEETLVGRAGRNYHGQYNPWIAATHAHDLLVEELAAGKHPRLAGLLASKVLRHYWDEQFRFLVPDRCPLGGPTVDEV